MNARDVASEVLPNGALNIVSLLAARFLAGIGEPHVIAGTEPDFECAEYHFKAKAKQVGENSRKEVVAWMLGGKKKKDNDSACLPSAPQTAFSIFPCCNIIKLIVGSVIPTM